jgi:hypothetical protein
MSKNTKVKINLPSKPIGKGTPPSVQQASKNLAHPLEGERVAMNFRVPAEFRKIVKQYALDNNMTAVQILTEAIEEYIKK